MKSIVVMTLAFVAFWAVMAAEEEPANNCNPGTNLINLYIWPQRVRGGSRQGAREGEGPQLAFKCHLN